MTGKPKALFFSPPITPDNSPIRFRQEQLYTDWLSHHFELVVIQDDCDYAELCDRHRPAIAILESGKSIGHRRLAIANLDRHPDIPKVGFARCDAFCLSRTIAINDFLDWGVEAVFSLDVRMADYLPGLADRLFVVPHFVETANCRDYGEDKLLPVALFGALIPSRPWRLEVFDAVRDALPVYLAPHDGYVRKQGVHMVVGEAYARTLNRAWFAPADGGLTATLVKKHLEVPACRACLVAPRLEALAEMGFRDMENCVLGTPEEVTAKMVELFDAPERLQAVVDAGFRLVHDRHRPEHRRHLADWLDCRRKLGPGQAIVQDSLCGPLRVADAPAGPFRLSDPGTYRQIMVQADSFADAGQFQQAVTGYDHLIKMIFYAPEPHLGKARCLLFAGLADEALKVLTFPTALRLQFGRGWPAQTGGPAPLPHDAVELAWQLLCLLCQGKHSEAAGLAGAVAADPRARFLAHPDLAEALRAVALLTGTRAELPPSAGPIATLHARGTWRADAGRALAACGQGRAAAVLAG